MLEKIGNALPYKVGDKLKIYVRDVVITGQGAIVTYGKVVAVNEKGHEPVVTYKDFRELPLCRFNRFVLVKEVTFQGKFKQFKNVNGALRQIHERIIEQD
jgi:hypothetical protein